MKHNSEDLEYNNERLHIKPGTPQREVDSACARHSRPRRFQISRNSETYPVPLRRTAPDSARRRLQTSIAEFAVVAFNRKYHGASCPLQFSELIVTCSVSERWLAAAREYNPEHVYQSRDYGIFYA
ncbi:hypothetical protein EVAR_37589_1 [Eumeta japonica]|uniref:Uncharacterized protein n=1 Tax=Eumeta variegata TaxID=151549 RepID=A0A4C1VM32_EUMVA|nr:hypothetical protein EVAR_37589_1 [Eumeta japonica]